MSWRYLIRRIAIFLIVILIAITVNFGISHAVPGDPVGAILAQLASQGATIDNGAQIVAEYRQRFGLDAPLPIQYLAYLWNTLHLDLGVSITHYPAGVTETIGAALPWTIGLLVVATIIAFGIGSVLGAVLAWPRAPRILSVFAPALTVFSAVPYYLLALILLYLLGVWSGLFPLGGGRSPGAEGEFGPGAMLDIAYHAVLPALSIVLAGLGFWALNMRGAMINVLGEDYLILADAKGLRPGRIFFAYGMRNALLPQITSLALSLGTIVSGSVLVEVAFNYPGLGFLLYDALRGSDYFMIQGICLFLVITVATAVLVLDLVYPLLDPRISRQDR